MTQFETIKKRLKELEIERDDLEIQLYRMENSKIGAQAVSWVLGVFFVVSNGAWFAAWSWV